MSAASAGFSVKLTASSSSNVLAPALQWYCRHSEQCSYSASVLSSGQCAKSILKDSNQFAENIAKLAGGCNEIFLENGQGLFDGVACDKANESTEACPALLYRYNDGRNVDAFCPVGTEMIVSAMGTVGDIDYIFSPAPGVELLGETPPDCSIVNDAYQCDSGFVSLRFTASGDDSFCNVQNGETCPIPTAGVAYGFCAGSCANGPDPLEAPVAESFSVVLKTTSSSNALAPSLEWTCRQDSYCTVSAPPQEVVNCVPTEVTNFTQYAELTRNLASGCNEILLKQGAALLGDGSCNVLGDIDGESYCGAVMYRYPDGRNVKASCPSGTEMVLSVTGAVGAIEYIVEPELGSELIGILPNDCIFIANGYRCKSGFVRLPFTQSSNKCVSRDGDCDIPQIGYLYGQCEGSAECSNGPEDVVPSVPGNEFAVKLQTDSSSNALAPSLEFYCRQNQECSLSTSALATSCPKSNFSTFNEFGEKLKDLTGPCNQIILEDAASLFGIGLGCSSSDQCAGILFHYPDGRNNDAVCPTGSEMIVQAIGAVGNINYLFTPQGEGIEMLGELPAGCVFAAGAYRCQSGQVQIRFTHSAAKCDATGTGEGCGKPLSGSVYGLCGEALDCLNDVPIDEVFFEEFVPPTARPQVAPTPRPMEPQTLNPTSLSTDSAPESSTNSSEPSSSPSVAPSTNPSFAPSLSAANDIQFKQGVTIWLVVGIVAALSANSN